MDDFFMRRNHVPAFGSWDCSNDGLPFTQCFDSARQAGLLRYSYSDHHRDLYVAGDDVLTPAMILVPRRRGKARDPHVRRAKREAWVVCEVKVPASPVSPPPPPPPSKRRPRKAAKAVDEDLYKISPDLLHAKLKRKRGLGFFLSCLMPTCAS